MGYRRRRSAFVRTLVSLFALSACFGVVIGVAYGIVARGEAVGIALFALVSAALVFCAAWALAAERDAKVEGDRADATASDLEGDVVGTFTVASAWPLPAALATGATLLGTLWSPTLAVFGLVGLIVCLWRMGAESARL
jgi:hypothetical protein